MPKPTHAANLTGIFNRALAGGVATIGGMIVARGIRDLIGAGTSQPIFNA